MTRPHLDVELARIARVQHGAFARRQAAGLGFTAEEIEHRVRVGAWVRLDAAVYALPGNPATWLRQCAAATLGEERAVVSGRSAAVLHGFPGFRPGRVEITVPRGSNHRSRIARIRQSDFVETTRAQQIPVVTVGQAAIEVARFFDEAGFGALVDALVASDRRVLPALRERYVELCRSRWPGIGRVRAVLALRGDGYVPPDSLLEAKLLEVLATLPSFGFVQPQAPLPWRPATRQRVDVLVPDLRLIIEADGRRWHTRVDDFERDHERDTDALLHGYRVLRVTWHQLVHKTRWVRGVIAQLDGLALAA